MEAERERETGERDAGEEEEGDWGELGRGVAGWRTSSVGERREG